MKQKEVTDKQNTKWTCVEAYSMLQPKTAEKAAALSENEAGNVNVVCTPTGGAKTVRLELAHGWQDMNDERLIEEIQNAKGAV
jgi:hypothetical protein